MERPQRTVLYLPEAMKIAVKRRSQADTISSAAVIRQAISAYIEKAKSITPGRRGS